MPRKDPLPEACPLSPGDWGQQTASDHQLLQGQPQHQGGRLVCLFCPACRAGPECSKCFPASRFDFFCPILLLVLSLGTQTLSRLLLLEHSAFNRKTLGSLKVSGVQIQQVSQYQYVESFLYCPKDFCATGQDPMVRQNEWEVHTFPWWSKWGAEDGDQLTHHSHFPFSVDF